MAIARRFRNLLCQAIHALRTAGFTGLPEGWGAFSKSTHATTLLGDLSGVEVGGSAHNDYCLSTRNIDFVDHVVQDTIYAREQRRLCGRVMPVDLIAPGNCIPIEDVSTDFVLASHVIEHFYDPIEAIIEWVRVAKRYVYIVAPHRDRTFDRDREPTPVEELCKRHLEPASSRPTHDNHWSVWRTSEFVELVEFMGLPIECINDVDDKVGNGFTVVIGDLISFDRERWKHNLRTKLDFPTGKSSHPLNGPRLPR